MSEKMPGINWVATLQSLDSAKIVRAVKSQALRTTFPHGMCQVHATFKQIVPEVFPLFNTDAMELNKKLDAIVREMVRTDHLKTACILATLMYEIFRVEEDEDDLPIATVNWSYCALFTSKAVILNYCKHLVTDDFMKPFRESGVAYAIRSKLHLCCNPYCANMKGDSIGYVETYACGGACGARYCSRACQEQAYRNVNDACPCKKKYLESHSSVGACAALV